MSWYLIIQTVLAAVVVIVAWFAVGALIQLKQTLVGVENLARSVNDELLPLLSKAQVTLDEVNSELARVDGLVTSLQEVGDRVQTTTDAARKVIASPAVKLSGVASGLKVTLVNLISGRRKR